MGHYVRNTGWATIDVESSGGLIFVQSRWKYQWLTSGQVTRWTHPQQLRFHNGADRIIWRDWSGRVFLTTQGNSDFADRTQGRAIPVSFDVRWVLHDPHWDVRVTKIAPGEFKRSNVQWNARLVEIDSEDLTIKTSSPAGHPQYAVSHEYGHVIGNTAVLGRGDEYDSGPNQSDTIAIMNAGNQLRERYFRTLIEELEILLPDTTFTVDTITQQAQR